MTIVSRNPDAIAWAGVAGLLLMFAALIPPHGLPDVPAASIAGAVAGFALFLICEAILIVRNYKGNRSGGDRELRARASNRWGRENFTGVMIMAAGLFMQATHSIFAAPQFRGEWAVSFALGVIGMSVQMLAQARYIKAIG